MKSFRSKVDGWYYGVLASIPLVILVPALLSSSSADDLPSIGISMIALALPVWLLVSTFYTIGDEELLIRSGPFNWTIKLADIRKIESSRSVLSSPALSLDRLKIEYEPGKVILVSPKDKEAFVKALQIGSIAE